MSACRSRLVVLLHRTTSNLPSAPNAAASQRSSSAASGGSSSGRGPVLVERKIASLVAFHSSVPSSSPSPGGGGGGVGEEVVDPKRTSFLTSQQHIGTVFFHNVAYEHDESKSLRGPTTSRAISGVGRRARTSTSRQDPSRPPATERSFWTLSKKTATSDNAINSRSNTGLFGLPQLLKPRDYDTLCQDAIREANQLLDEAVEKSQRLQTKMEEEGTFETCVSEAVKVLKLLDSISDAVCKVVDSAELCRNVHSSVEWRQQAEQASATLLHFIFQLNTKPSLYHALCTVTKHKSLLRQLSSEQQRVALLLQHEFERDGIHLPQEQREQQVQLSDKASRLGMQFSRNISGSCVYFTLGPVERLRHISGLQAFLTDKNDSEWITLPTNPSICNAILRSVEDESIRRDTKKAMYRAYEDNIPILHELVATRRQLAQLIGFRSYGDFVMFDRMADSPEEVILFLHRLSNKIRKKGHAEFKAMQRAKHGHLSRHGGIPVPLKTSELAEFNTLDQLDRPHQELGYDASSYWDDHKCSDTSLDALETPVYSWDASYYKQLLQSHWFEFDNSLLKPYFSLKNMIDGIGLIVNELFGITLQEVELHDNEAWDCQNARKSSLRKFVLIHEEDGPLGTIYLDMFARPNKSAGAAHYVVRCGRQLYWEAGHDSQVEHPATLPGNNIESSKEFQMPIVSLIMSFSPNQGGGQGDKEVLLTPPEVETLFHEFGHALHSLLSRTEFQHLSGTRGALDFVELPSHLFEYFATDWRVLQRFAKHYDTGEPVPKALVERYKLGKKAFSATELQSQIVHAMLDQALYSANPRAVARSTYVASGGPGEGLRDDVHYEQHIGGFSDSIQAEEQDVDSTRLLWDIEKRHSFLEPLEYSAWPGAFSHLVNYGAGYYSYLYARMFAAAVWRKLFSENPLDRNAGEIYRRKVGHFGMMCMSKKCSAYCFCRCYRKGEERIRVNYLGAS
eukprot:gb/GECG01008092.1/.p1 GENE.gb/GECG01008092.1/~~gb/GECG01008092.1/.p1  ORF type:complete len:963 (+),score=122.89 gb/GECG01008092.1/:1-2889(+)